jgi:hypothetical protein
MAPDLALAHEDKRNFEDFSPRAIFLSKNAEFVKN